MKLKVNRFSFVNVDKTKQMYAEVYKETRKGEYAAERHGEEVKRSFDNGKFFVEINDKKITLPSKNGLLIHKNHEIVTDKVFT
jgi:hypothetical protein